MSAATIAAALAWYEANIADCPRSPEWKAGARAGCWQAHGLVPSPNPYPSGTCQDDARRAGAVYGYEQARHDLASGVRV